MKIVDLITDVRVVNLLKAASIFEPEHATMAELIRIPGMGPNRILLVAQTVAQYKHLIKPRRYYSNRTKKG